MGWWPYKQQAYKHKGSCTASINNRLWFGWWVAPISIQARRFCTASANKRLWFGLRRPCILGTHTLLCNHFTHTDSDTHTHAHTHMHTHKHTHTLTHTHIHTLYRSWALSLVPLWKGHMWWTWNARCVVCVCVLSEWASLGSKDFVCMCVIMHVWVVGGRCGVLGRGGNGWECVGWACGCVSFTIRYSHLYFYQRKNLLPCITPILRTGCC